MDWNHINAALYSVSRLLDVEQGQLLYETARSLDEGARILEIGAWKGYSTCCLAFGCLGRGGLVYTIDAFTGNPYATNLLDGPYSFDEFWHNIEMLRLEQLKISVYKYRAFSESSHRDSNSLPVDEILP